VAHVEYMQGGRKEKKERREEQHVTRYTYVLLHRYDQCLAGVRSRTSRHEVLHPLPLAQIDWREGRAVEGLVWCMAIFSVSVYPGR
jgi:hypothetical protein